MSDGPPAVGPDASTTEPTFRVARTNGVGLRVAEAGPPAGPLVVLLHGFPESWYAWRHLIAPLAAEGYRVVAPDQRGYGTSARPKGVEAYRIDELVADVVGLIDESGRDRAAVVGHDWGGVVAWRAIARHPDRFDRAAILNAPDLDVLRRSLRLDASQRRRSWYVFLFQLPWLAEWWLSRHDFRALEGALRSTSRPGTFSAEDLAVYRRGWSEPGALRGMINWYRAAFRVKAGSSADELVGVETLIFWGALDHALGPNLARASYARCVDAEIRWFEGATHWVHLEEPEAVSAAILAFLAGKDPPE